MALRLEVYVQPRASRTGFAGLHDGVIKIRLAAPPVEDAANRELIAFIAQHLGIPRRYVRIASGAASRRKVLDIEGLSAAQLAARMPQDTTTT